MTHIYTHTHTHTCTAPGDYSAVSGFSVVFGPDEEVKTVEVPIVNDDLLEEDENFFGRLVTSDPDVDVINPNAEVTIIDDESKPFYNNTL